MQVKHCIFWNAFLRLKNMCVASWLNNLMKKRSTNLRNPWLTSSPLGVGSTILWRHSIILSIIGMHDIIFSFQSRILYLKNSIRPKCISKHFLKKSNHAFQTERHPRRFSVEGNHKDVDKFDLNTWEMCLNNHFQDCHQILIILRLPRWYHGFRQA